MLSPRVLACCEDLVSNLEPCLHGRRKKVNPLTPPPSILSGASLLLCRFSQLTNLSFPPKFKALQPAGSSAECENLVSRKCLPVSQWLGKTGWQLCPQGLSAVGPGHSPGEAGWISGKTAGDCEGKGQPGKESADSELQHSMFGAGHLLVVDRFKQSHRGVSDRDPEELGR